MYNVDTVCKKLTNVCIFIVNRVILTWIAVLWECLLIIECFIESVLTFSFICRYVLLENKNCIHNIVSLWSKIANAPLNNIMLHKTSSLKKAQAILADTNHLFSL